MTNFEPKSFNLPAVEGISEDTLKGHIKLYEGYVKQANVILSKIEEYSQDSEKNAYALGELQRRFAFEFDGMRNHEYYFGALEGGPKPLNPEGSLAKAIIETWGSIETFMNRFKAIGLTRGIGWTMLYYDAHTQRLLTQWVDEQHLGHLTGLSPILGLDVWEHAYLRDYIPSDKIKYIEAYLSALNWETIELWFEKARA